MNPHNNILFYEQHGKNGMLGIIVLNRPAALNATYLEITKALYKKLCQWEVRDDIKAIIIKSNNERAFCAGGDLKAIYNNSNDYAFETFWDEYRLVHKIAKLSKPFISLTNGITMGGGVGISIYASHRVAASCLSFAMPETGIGFFPDIGASYFLQNTPGHIGRYLALTGRTINASDTLFCGLNDYVTEFNKFDSIITDITKTDMSSISISDVLQSYNMKNKTSNIEKLLGNINKYFGENNIENIMSTLAKSKEDWAQQTFENINMRSATSIHVTFKMLEQAKSYTLAQALAVEYQLACNFITNSDFKEGIRAQIIDKDKTPKWQPNNIKDVNSGSIDFYFKKNKNDITFSDSDKFN